METSLCWLDKLHKHILYTYLKIFLLFVVKFVENVKIDLFFVEINIDTFSNS